MEDNLDQLNNMLKSLLKKLGKKAGKHLLKLLAPFMPYIIIVLLVVFFVLMLVAATYSSMPSAGTLTGIAPSSQDAVLKQDYITQANYYDTVNTWQVGGIVTPGNETTGEPISKPFYIPNANYGSEGFKNLSNTSKMTPTGDSDVDVVPDECGYVPVQALTWGLLQSTNLYIAYNFNEPTVSQANIKPLAIAMQPYFFYKESEIITTSVDSKGKSHTTIQYVRLLTEAYTVYGHHEYFYKWQTTHTKTITQTEEVPDKVVKIPSNYFLDTFNKFFDENYQTTSNPDYQQAKIAIFQGGQGFTQETEWMTWLQNTVTGGTGSISPPGGTPISGSGGTFPYTQNILQYESYINEYAQQYNLPPALVCAIMAQESGGNPDSISLANCLGLMQLSADKFTEAELDSGEWEDPNLNIQMGCEYIRSVADTLGYGSDFASNPVELQNVIAGYNAGPGAVLEYGGIPPYAETQTYVPDVLSFYQQFQGLLGQGGNGG